VTATITGIKDSAAWFVLNRPDEMNALNQEIIDSPDSFPDTVFADPAIRCVAITGTGRAFCSGAAEGLSAFAENEHRSLKVVNPDRPTS